MLIGFYTIMQIGNDIRKTPEILSFKNLLVLINKIQIEPKMSTY